MQVVLPFVPRLKCPSLASTVRVHKWHLQVYSHLKVEFNGINLEACGMHRTLAKSLVLFRKASVFYIHLETAQLGLIGPGLTKEVIVHNMVRTLQYHVAFTAHFRSQ